MMFKRMAALLLVGLLLLSAAACTTVSNKDEEAAVTTTTDGDMLSTIDDTAVSTTVSETEATFTQTTTQKPTTTTTTTKVNPTTTTANASTTIKVTTTTTKITTAKVTTTTKATTTTTTQPSDSQYEKIYNEYAQKIREAAPTSGMMELAKIETEGVQKMAQYMLSAKGTDGQYGTYMEWAGKLSKVYLSAQTTTTKSTGTTASLSSDSQYEEIYNEYAQKIREAAPTSGMMELAALATEGIQKMAQYMIGQGADGQYETYMEWAEKLSEVYFSVQTTTIEPVDTTVISPSNSQYEKIYNEYAQKIREAAPASSMMELAALAIEGIQKMAQYMTTATGTDGQYATYQGWVNKLTAVYMDEVI